MSTPMLKSLRVSGLLSFGPEPVDIPLTPLNVLIGPNGSGKSNTIEVLSLLQAAPTDITRPIRKGGGVQEWVWKGASPQDAWAMVEVLVRNPFLPRRPEHSTGWFRYRLKIYTLGGSPFLIGDETLEDENAQPGQQRPSTFFEYENGRPMLSIRGGPERREVQQGKLNPQQSILSQRREPELYPEITNTAELFSRIRIYREWSFGRLAPARLPQRTDLPNDHLDEDTSNLALVLSRLRQYPEVKRSLVRELGTLSPHFDDFELKLEGGTVQIVFIEGGFTIPATRLSDGTLRYLCLLAILLDPTPPPLVCIEEPELGLHPDMMPQIARLLREASERMQLVVTTHSDALVSALSDTPESVIVCEKEESKTSLERLNAAELKPWLEKYRLGQLWMRGDLGGTRW